MLYVADVFFPISNVRGVLNTFTCIEYIEKRVWGSTGHPSPMLCGKITQSVKTDLHIVFCFFIEPTTVILEATCGKNHTPFSPSVLKCDQIVDSNTENVHKAVKKIKMIN